MCTTCDKSLTASISTGNGGRYPRYHCTQKTCRKKVTGKPASVDVDKVHKDFRKVLKDKQPVIKDFDGLFRAIVLRTWNNEYKLAIENAEQISRELNEYRELRVSVDEKYIAGKLSDEDRDLHLKRINQKIGDAEDQRETADKYIKEKEQIIDDATTFIKQPDVFWNHANTRTKQMIQHLLFPTGVPYDFETGFGTSKDIDTYLLIQKIAENSAKFDDLVAGAGLEPATSWL